MSPVLMSSQSFVLAAAMAVSGAVIFLSFGRPRPFPATHMPEKKPPTSGNRPLRSCLSSDEGRRERGKKSVRFAEEVKVVEVRRSRPSIKKLTGATTEKPSGDEILAVDHEMPPNRVALYHGILRDRAHAHRMECSY